MESFLDGFWRENIEGLLNESASRFGKRIEVVSLQNIFFSFYCVSEYRVIDVTIERC